LQERAPVIFQTFRDVMGAAGGVGTRIGHLVVEELDGIIAQFTGLWNVQHKDDGSHSNVTADSLDVTGDLEVGGDLEVARNLLVGGAELTFAQPGSIAVAGDVEVSGTVVAQDALVHGGVLIEGNLNLDMGSSALFNGTVDGAIGYRERGRANEMGEWESYTPAWTASGGNPSLGNGSIAGQKMYVGRTVWFTIQLVIGSTTTLGTGLWEFSLPETPGGILNVNAFAVDNGVRLYLGQGVGLSATTIGLWLSDATAGTESWAQAGFPFAWGNGDTIQVKGCYRF
jgi:hypothetical protein